MAYCKLVVENGLEPLVIPNLGKHELTSCHPATSLIGMGVLWELPNK